MVNGWAGVRKNSSEPYHRQSDHIIGSEHARDAAAGVPEQPVDRQPVDRILAPDASTGSLSRILADPPVHRDWQLSESSSPSRRRPPQSSPGLSPVRRDAPHSERRAVRADRHSPDKGWELTGEAQLPHILAELQRTFLAAQEATARAAAAGGGGGGGPPPALMGPEEAAAAEARSRRKAVEARWLRRLERIRNELAVVERRCCLADPQGAEVVLAVRS